MNSDLGVSPAEAQWVATQRRWTQGWRRYLLSGAFLVYLVFVIPTLANNRHPLGAVLGFVILVAFAACFLALVREGRQAAPRRFWALYGVLVALFAAELPLAGDASFVMCLYLTESAVIRLDLSAAPIVVLLALASLLAPAAIPSWHTSVKDAFDGVTPLAIPIVALVSLGVLRVFEGNRALAQARAELARLSAENERNRIARDLHDLLGHSLTTITVKAGLARQIGKLDPARASGDRRGRNAGPALALRRARRSDQLSGGDARRRARDRARAAARSRDHRRAAASR
ncbi:MAG: histidine kinase [Solirubrobacteraceae bacterium]